MKKTLLAPSSPPVADITENWLDLDRAAAVELSSEDPAHPIEAAIGIPPHPPGWRAGNPGPQTIALRFNSPQDLRLIHLQFECHETRTHEFQLTYVASGETAEREIVRQQYHFAPEGATFEEENFVVALRGVTRLILHLKPDLSGRPVHATLRQWRIR